MTFEPTIEQAAIMCRRKRKEPNMTLSPSERYNAQNKLAKSSEVISWYYDGILSRRETVMRLMSINKQLDELVAEKMIDDLKSAYGVDP